MHSILENGNFLITKLWYRISFFFWECLSSQRKWSPDVSWAVWPLLEQDGQFKCQDDDNDDHDNDDDDDNDDNDDDDDDDDNYDDDEDST